MSHEVMECCLKCANNIVASDNSILELFLSSFLGFLSALAVEALWGKYKDFQLCKQIKENLKKELCEVKRVLDGLEKSKVYMKPYSISIWKGACESGSILILDKKEGFIELIKLYSLIEEANLVEMKAFEISNMNNVNNKRIYVDSVLESRKKIEESIDSVISSLEGR